MKSGGLLDFRTLSLWACTWVSWVRAFHLYSMVGTKLTIMHYKSFYRMFLCDHFLSPCFTALVSSFLLLWLSLGFLGPELCSMFFPYNKPTKIIQVGKVWVLYHRLGFKILIIYPKKKKKNHFKFGKYCNSVRACLDCFSNQFLLKKTY